MRIHYLQHVAFEDLGSMAPLFAAMGHDVTLTRLYANETLPESSAFDALVVMGGPMGVDDGVRFPWLAAEKALLKDVIYNTDKPVLGICLGAQLIAEVMGAAVSRNAYSEIGWFPLQLTAQFQDSYWGSCLENGAEVFHWHGDTFALPEGAMAIGASEACRNQGFIVDDRIVALQFHLETTAQTATALINECGDELDGGQYVQQATEMLAKPQRFTQINAAMAELVKRWLA